MEAVGARLGVAGGAPPAMVDITYCCAQMLPPKSRKPSTERARIDPLFHHPQSQIPQVAQQQVRLQSLKFLDGCNPRFDRNRPNPVGPRRLNILRRIADQRYRRLAPDPPAPARLADGEFRQPRASLRHLSEGAEREVSVQPGALQLAPPDARQIPGHQAQQYVTPRQPFEHRHYTRAMFAAQFGTPSVVVFSPVTRRTPCTSAARWCGPARRSRVPSISNKTSARCTWSFMIPSAATMVM